MRETRADTAQAILFAVALHAVLLAMVLFGMWWTRTHDTVSAAGAPVQADVVDANALSAAMRSALSRPVVQPSPPPVEAAAPPPQPIPEPSPQEAPTPQQNQAQERVPVPDTIDQARVDRDALSAQTREREQEEKHRQEQVDLTERQRQTEAENRQRLAQMETQRLQQLDQQIKKIREARRKAAHEADLAEQKLQQIADARSRNAAQAAAQADSDASPPAGNNGTDADLAARYVAALQAAIVQNWIKPDSVPAGQRCKIIIRQLPGGEVIDVQVSPSCPYDDPGKRNVEAAVLKAAPLPYAGFEPVFSRTLILNFEAR